METSAKQRILIVYSTTDGHTLVICRRLQAVIEQHGQQVTVVDIDAAHDVDLAAYDKIVIGASIRYGKHKPTVARFIARHQPLLESKPNAFFSVNVVARKAEKNAPHSNPYLLKFLRRISWKPKQLAVFAGKIDYPRYGRIDRMMIRFIMWMTKGPTHRDAVVEFTDWQKVEAFGRVVSDM